MRYMSRDGAGVRIGLRKLESLCYDEIYGMENDKRRHLIEQKRPKARWWTLACTSARSTCVITIAVFTVESLGKTSLIKTACRRG